MLGIAACHTTAVAPAARPPSVTATFAAPPTVRLRHVPAPGARFRTVFASKYAVYSGATPPKAVSVTSQVAHRTILSTADDGTFRERIRFEAMQGSEETAGVRVPVTNAIGGKSFDVDFSSDEFTSTNEQGGALTSPEREALEVTYCGALPEKSLVAYLASLDWTLGASAQVNPDDVAWLSDAMCDDEQSLAAITITLVGLDEHDALFAVRFSGEARVEELVFAMIGSATIRIELESAMVREFILSGVAGTESEGRKIRLVQTFSSFTEGDAP